jgi:hypothetical protein
MATYTADEVTELKVEGVSYQMAVSSPEELSLKESSVLEGMLEIS